MGDKLRTMQNLEIIKSDLENNLIFIKGSVPGSKNSLVLIKQNSKNINKSTFIEKIKKVQAEISKSAVKTKDKSKTPDKKEKSNPKTEGKTEVKK